MDCQYSTEVYVYLYLLGEQYVTSLYGMGRPSVVCNFVTPYTEG